MMKPEFVEDEASPSHGTLAETTDGAQVEVKEQVRTVSDSRLIDPVSAELGKLAEEDFGGKLKDVWQNVFDKLDERDQMNFTRVCKPLYDLMGYKRTQLLFREILPTLEQALPENSFMDCRNTCQSWNKEFDQVLQTKELLLLLDCENDVECEFFRFETANKIQKFLRLMENHPGNPFPDRELHVQWHTVAMEQAGHNRCREFYDALVLLLETFGKHIHFESLNVTDRCRLGMEFEIFEKCMRCLPNLRRLNLYWEANIPMEPIAFGPFPNLESIEVSPSIPEFITYVLERYCVPTNIKRLSTSLIANPVFPDLPEVVYTFFNLERLDLTLNVADMERFQNAPRLPPLKKVFLDFMDVNPEFERSFRSLEAFAETLKIVCVNFAYSDGLRTANGYQINLPKLESLTIKGFKGPTSLAHLDIEAYEGQTWDESVLHFGWFFGSMYHSNIWTLITSLRKLTVNSDQEKREYDRETWEKIEETGEY